MMPANDVCRCGLPKWKHSKWASRPDREQVLRAHSEQGLPSVVESFEPQTNQGDER